MKSVFVLFLFFLSTMSFGQSVLDKGNYQLAGGLSFEKTQSKNDYFNDRALKIELSPQYSYFVINNLLVGGLISLKYMEYQWLGTEDDKSSQKSIGFGPNIKYYFRTEKIIPFVSSSVVYEKIINETEYGYTLDFSAGFDVFLTQSVALEPFVSYNIRKNFSPVSSQTIMSFGVRFNYFIVK